MVYYTGDTIDHYIWATSKESNKRVMDQVHDKFKEKFPNIPVFIVPGNHEAHPTNV